MIELKNEKETQRDILGLQAAFAAYVLRAVQNKRCDYIRREMKYHQMEELREEPQPEIETDCAGMFEEALPLEMCLDSVRLLSALESLSVRERDIFLSHVLDDMSFSSLGAKYCVSYAGAAAAYYRVVVKLRKQVEDDDVDI